MVGTYTGTLRTRQKALLNFVLYCCAMPSCYFPAPPVSLPQAEQQGWLARLHQAEQIVGITEAGLPQVSAETLSLWQRYVQGELTLAQLLILQRHRLQVRS